MDHGEVARDWTERGFTCATVIESPAPRSRPEKHSKDALMAVAEGRLIVEMHGVDYVLEPGDELFIPRGAPFAVHNDSEEEVRCFFGLD